MNNFDPNFNKYLHFHSLYMTKFEFLPCYCYIIFTLHEFLIVSIVVELFADSGALGDNFPPLPDNFELTFDESEGSQNCISIQFHFSVMCSKNIFLLILCNQLIIATIFFFFQCMSSSQWGKEGNLAARIL